MPVLKADTRFLSLNDPLSLSCVVASVREERQCARFYGRDVQRTLWAELVELGWSCFSVRPNRRTAETFNTQEAIHDHAL